MILEGGAYDNYDLILGEEYKIAVCLTLFQAYAEFLDGLKKSGVSTETLYTQRVFGFLEYIPVDYQALTIRNAGPREHGPFDMNLIQHFMLLKVPGVMKVYLSIRQKWSNRGYDWDRRNREEVARVYQD